MEDNRIAQTQYNDLMGTVAIDGRYGGSFLSVIAAKANLAAGHRAIGLKLLAAGPEPHIVAFDLLTVDTEVVGDNMDSWIEKASAGELTVFRYTVEFTFEELFKEIKRFTVVALLNGLYGFPLGILDDH